MHVHVRSVAAAAFDSVTDEVFQSKLTLAFEHIRSWIADLPGPTAVTCEAGPTGSGFYRPLTVDRRVIPQGFPSRNSPCPGVLSRG